MQLRASAAAIISRLPIATTPRTTRSPVTWTFLQAYAGAGTDCACAGELYLPFAHALSHRAGSQGERSAEQDPGSVQLSSHSVSACELVFTGDFFGRSSWAALYPPGLAPGLTWTIEMDLTGAARKARVSFQDVAAHFSKEDWKLLQEWQTELYEIVIKEIHHALTSLGPLIATAVFSLRPKEKDELLILDQECSKIRDGSKCPSTDTITNSDVSFRNPRTAKLEMKDTEDPNQWGNQYYPNAGFPFSIPDIALREEQAFESNLKDNCATEIRECNIGLSADIQVIIKEEESYSRDLHTSGRGEDIYMNTEHEEITQIPCIIKEDGTAHSMEHEDSVMRGSIYVPTDDRVFKRKINYKESDKCTRKASLLGKVKTKGLQRTQKQICKLAKMFPGSNQDLGDKSSAPCGSGYVKDAYTNLHPGTVKEGTLEINNGCESEAQSTALVMYPQDGRKLTSSNCEQNISHVEDLENVDLGSRLGDVSSLSNQCAVYNKTFDQLENQIALERTLSTDRPYVCVKCYKRFRNMWKLTRHQATHSKERPYICAECGKNYNRSDSLLRHQKSHSERLIGPCETWTTTVYEPQK